MSKDELIAFLKENLTVEVVMDNGSFYDNKYIETKVMLKLGGDVISEYRAGVYV